MIDRIVSGHDTCEGLSERGHEQAARLRDRLLRTDELRDATAMFTSILPRAIETAATIAPALGTGALGHRALPTGASSTRATERDCRSRSTTIGTGCSTKTTIGSGTSAGDPLRASPCSSSESKRRYCVWSNT